MFNPLIGAQSLGASSSSCCCYDHGVYEDLDTNVIIGHPSEKEFLIDCDKWEPTVTFVEVMQVDDLI